MLFGLLYTNFSFVTYISITVSQTFSLDYSASLYRPAIKVASPIKQTASSQSTNVTDQRVKSKAGKDHLTNNSKPEVVRTSYIFTFKQSCNTPSPSLPLFLSPPPLLFLQLLLSLTHTQPSLKKSSSYPRTLTVPSVTRTTSWPRQYSLLSSTHATQPTDNKPGTLNVSVGKALPNAGDTYMYIYSVYMALLNPQQMCPKWGYM